MRNETGIDFLARGHGSGGGASSGGGHRSGGPAPMPTAQPFGNETYGLSPTFLQQLGIEGPLCNRIFIANVIFYHI